VHIVVRLGEGDAAGQVLDVAVEGDAHRVADDLDKHQDRLEQAARSARAAADAWILLIVQ
jgi:hypothetical protein